ncbi:hypothetical protein B7760_03142 [Burkholderia glumae]|nr:hypothetical protein B7760_03142 [Burkholderia glumae]
MCACEVWVRVPTCVGRWVVSVAVRLTGMYEIDTPANQCFVKL